MHAMQQGSGLFASPAAMLLRPQPTLQHPFPSLFGFDCCASLSEIKPLLLAACQRCVHFLTSLRALPDPTLVCSSKIEKDRAVLKPPPDTARPSTAFGTHKDKTSGPDLYKQAPNTHFWKYTFGNTNLFLLLIVSARTFSTRVLDFFWGDRVVVSE